MPLNEPSESIANLTKPQLYSLYDENIVSPEESFAVLQKADNKDIANRDKAKFKYKSKVGKFNKIVSNVIIFALMGNIYSSLLANLHDYKISFYRNEQSNSILTNSLEGIFCGLITPLIDWLLGLNTCENDLVKIFRICNAMLGVIFGVRKIQWTSSLQGSIAWFLLNFILWLFFDGTPSLFIISSFLSYLTGLYHYSVSNEWSEVIYLIDFYFLGLIIFGKIGRYLFR
ncbi:hypothetical protein KAFR_0A07300 [Kazachstania africana CBS 2517]|uniref:Uncharacterized protein n=1 Tax=Kazachstania africana (strain ATCC 22294 / BCRC 22015 / CBS 2517 / CECT 1963 / NBRC 1671 / NRRL Y-8276) TaxID=1071382 RepID=H2AP64_KAZAF|nr:hypothetical protein KAFR_0A07300 [Kazachstania africana CBS 2517]CCF56164.1 hypothetical protein KAFR_0A07300 [Kazachstania africana CBS 2517]